MSEIAVGTALYHRLFRTDGDVAAEIGAEHTDAMPSNEARRHHDDQADDEQRLTTRVHRE